MLQRVATIGLDVGTTGVKALLVDPAGRVVAEASAEYPLSTPRPLWSEQNPADWWQATRDALRRVAGLARAANIEVVGLGLTGQMHGLVLLDGRGRVLRPAILWNDQRTGPQCAAITQRVGAARLIELTGNPVLPGFTAPKIAWVREHEPQIHHRIAHVLLPKDHVRYCLTGQLLSDVADASGTALFDVARRCWSDDMLAAFDVPRSWLPEVTESIEPSSRLSQPASHDLDLPAGLPIVAGAGDQAAQAVGSGVVREGVVSATLGTSGVVFAASGAYRADPAGRLHAFCHAVPGQWHLMGVMLSAAGSFRWWRDVLRGSPLGPGRAADGAGGDGTDGAGGGSAPSPDDYERMAACAAAAPPGCEGLVYLPYLSGERTPHPDPHARGAFIGLTLRHGAAHLTRSVMEGVAFGLCDSLQLMRELGISPNQVRASGGGASSPLWRQILADVFRVEIVRLNVTQGAAFGAAILAQVGVGLHASLADAAQAIVQPIDRTRPTSATQLYGALYDRFRALYPALRAEFAALGGAIQP